MSRLISGLLLLCLCAVCAQAQPPTPATQSAEAIPQVTVSAQREKIEPQVHRFVNDFLYLENDEEPARWISRVCPAVMGMKREEAEFILLRLSEIARKAGVPLDGEHCKPANLYVIATAHPAEVLHAWDKKTHGRIFGDAALVVENSFIDTPLPVRAWYNSTQVDSHSAAAGLVDLPPALSVGGNRTTFQAPGFTKSSASRIATVAAWSLSDVFIVVDSTKMGGFTWRQLADYVGMYAYSRLKPGIRHSDSPTILDLFNPASGQTASGLTAWDEAFLDALYHTNPALVGQNRLMVVRMVKHIVPDASPEPPSPQ